MSIDVHRPCLSVSRGPHRSGLEIRPSNQRFVFFLLDESACNHFKRNFLINSKGGKENRCCRTNTGPSFFFLSISLSFFFFFVFVSRMHSKCTISHIFVHVVNLCRAISSMSSNFIDIKQFKRYSKWSHYHWEMPTRKLSHCRCSAITERNSY